MPIDSVGHMSVWAQSEMPRRKININYIDQSDSSSSTTTIIVRMHFDSRDYLRLHNIHQSTDKVPTMERQTERLTHVANGANAIASLMVLRTFTFQ